VIVHPTQNGWQIIYHRAHALLAAQLAGHWRRKDAPPRLYETIAAISHHDDLAKEWEGNNITEGGTPKDFLMDEGDSYEPLRQHIERALYRGHWVALLNSMHQTHLNASKRGTSAEADAFLDEQLEYQKRWRKEVETSEAEANSAYAFMQWCDRLSLILCQRELPMDERALEISKGPDGQRYDVIQHSNGLITVTPWRFEDDRFTVNVEATSLSQVTFDDNESLVEALKHSPRKLLEWTFVKESPEVMQENHLS
jgi:hypothetical protein